MKKKVFLIIVLVIAVVTSQAQTNFGPPQIISDSAYGAQCVFAADIDGDGDVDILSAAAADNRIDWYENTDGQGTFGNRQTIYRPDKPRAVFSADLDGDGDMDVISAASADNKVAWYENDGQGVFGPQQIMQGFTDGARDVYAADMDGDEDNDVIFVATGNNKVGWFENTDGNGTFLAHNIPIEAVFGLSVFATDLDGDEDLDVLVSSWGEDMIKWSENTDGHGDFSSQNIISMTAEKATSVYAADMDNDGDLDVLSSSLGDNKITWYENTGSNGDFITHVISTETEGAQSVFAADMDNDGDMDVLSASSVDDKICWYENTDGTGIFGLQQVISNSADSALDVRAADIDGDGDLDVLSASAIDNEVCWYENMLISGIEDISNSGFSIYPNPTIGKITFNNTQTNIQLLRVVTLTGKTVFEKKEVLPGETIDISALPSGVYILNIRTDEGVMIKKAVKE